MNNFKAMKEQKKAGPKKARHPIEGESL